MSKIYSQRTGLEVAIIGMACRFPGAENIARFWENLKQGKESITFFSDQELLAAGVDPGLLANPAYVKAGGMLKDYDLFDSDFFGFTPADAVRLDPQVRLFLETAWHALEHANYSTPAPGLQVGVFAGASSSISWHASLLGSRKGNNSEDFQYMMLADKDFMATQLSYKLNLKGPSFVLNTACSTSLVAIDLACKNLLFGSCGLALAGGVSLMLPQYKGYLHEEGMIFSADGHCRPFDAEASGTVAGSGCGVLVLKSLEQAEEDGDNILAVIKATATNNDGNRKIGYTAPSIEGEAEVIRKALYLSEIEPQTISYVETHGTGTSLGDPVEIEGLTQAFKCESKQFCPLGAVKANIGHLDAAAGVAGVIKTVLAMQHKQIPPAINYSQPNPRIDFKNTPFYVNRELAAWDPTSISRRAGVSSFGIGGTNAHLILEEAPSVPAPVEEKGLHLFPFSAKSEGALAQRRKQLAEYLRQEDVSLEALSYTLQINHSAMPCRDFLIASGRTELAGLLSGAPALGPTSGKRQELQIVFLFPGQGSQRAAMASELYRQIPLFRSELDTCLAAAGTQGGYDWKELLLNKPEGSEELVNRTEVAQPLLFIFEYALAETLIKMGIKPSAMLGHSLGEYTAAAIAGAISLEEGISLVIQRGSLMQQAPAGKMLQAALSADEAEKWLEPGIEITVFNGKELTVFGGPEEAIRNLERRLDQAGIPFSVLKTSHAFHSSLVEPLMPAFRSVLDKIHFQAPGIPVVSNVTGSWGEGIPDPSYWLDHLRKPVQFARGMELLLNREHSLFVEVGPGTVLSGLIKRDPSWNESLPVVNMLPHDKDPRSGERIFWEAIGKLWQLGAVPQWQMLYGERIIPRIPLPGYPFQHKKYGVDNPSSQGLPAAGPQPLKRYADTADWYYVPGWKQKAALPGVIPQTPVLIIMDREKKGAELLRLWQERGVECYTVSPGSGFSREGEYEFTVPEDKPEEGFKILFKTLKELKKFPSKILYLRNLELAHLTLNSDSVDNMAAIAYYFLLDLARAFGKEGREQSDLFIIQQRGCAVFRDDELNPVLALSQGPAKIIPVENPLLKSRVIDLEDGDVSGASFWEPVVEECCRPLPEPLVAFRKGERWVPWFQQIRPQEIDASKQQVKERGVYLITGAFGGMGSSLALSLAEKYRARLILITRPETDEEVRDSRLKYAAALEQAGAEVEVIHSDLADSASLSAGLGKVLERWKKIDGIFHTAGVIDTAGMILNRKPEQCASVLKAKLQGTLVLAESLKGREPGFMVLCSSMGNHLKITKFGQVAYNAANEFLDSFARYYSRQTGCHAVAVDWSDWTKVGMSAKAALQGGAGEHNFFAGEFDFSLLSLEPKQGVSIFEKVADLPFPQVLISPVPLEPVFKQLARLEAAALSGGGKGEPGSQVRQPRPELSTPYEAPVSEAEAKMAAVWSGILGFDKIGLKDNFFELGGDSIKAIQLATLLKEAGFEVGTNEIFQSPTIGSLCKAAGSEMGGSEELVTGELLPSPAQRFLYTCQRGASNPEVEYQLLRLPGKIEPGDLERICRLLAGHHDVLRTSFDPGSELKLEIRAPGEDCFEVLVFDFSESHEPASEIGELAASLAENFELSEAALFKILLCRAGEWDYIVPMLPPLLIDSLSWEILLDDLALLYKQLSEGSAFSLPEKSRSFQAWTRGLSEQQVASEGKDLRGIEAGESFFESSSPLRNHIYDEYTLELEADLTNQLLNQANTAYSTTVGELLLSALFIALAKNRKAGIYRVDTVTPVQGTFAEYGRTVGRLAGLSSLNAHIPDVVEPGSIIKEVKDSVRRLSPGVLGVLPENANRVLEASSGVLYEYLPDFGGTQEGFVRENSFPLTFKPEKALRPQVLTVRCRTAENIRVSLEYDTGLISREVLIKLAEELKAACQSVADHCLGREKREVTSSDFRSKKLSADDLDMIKSQFKF